MKHSIIKKTGYLLTAVLFLFCCTSEKESFWRDVEKRKSSPSSNSNHHNHARRVLQQTWFKLLLTPYASKGIYWTLYGRIGRNMVSLCGSIVLEFLLRMVINFLFLSIRRIARLKFKQYGTLASMIINFIILPWIEILKATLLKNIGNLIISQFTLWGRNLPVVSISRMWHCHVLHLIVNMRMLAWKWTENMRK